MKPVLAELLRKLAADLREKEAAGPTGTPIPTQKNVTPNPVASRATGAPGSIAAGANPAVPKPPTAAKTPKPAGV